MAKLISSCKKFREICINMVQLLELVTKDRKNFKDIWSPFKYEIGKQINNINIQKLCSDIQKIKRIYQCQYIKQVKRKSQDEQIKTEYKIWNKNKVINFGSPDENNETMNKMRVVQSSVNIKRLSEFMNEQELKFKAEIQNFQQLHIISSKCNIIQLKSILTIGLLLKIYKTKSNQYQHIIHHILNALSNTQPFTHLNRQILHSFQNILNTTPHIHSFLSFIYTYSNLLPINHVLTQYLQSLSLNTLKQSINLLQSDQTSIIKLFSNIYPILIYQYQHSHFQIKQFISTNLNKQQVQFIRIFCVQVCFIKSYYIVLQNEELNLIKIQCLQNENKNEKQLKPTIEKSKKSKNNRQEKQIKKNIKQQGKYYNRNYDILMNQKFQKIKINNKLYKKTHELLQSIAKNDKRLDQLVIKSSQGQNKEYMTLRQDNKVPLIQISINYKSQ